MVAHLWLGLKEIDIFAVIIREIGQGQQVDFVFNTKHQMGQYLTPVW